MTAQTASAAPANAADGPATKTMKAIRIHRRGGPEALIYEDAPIPALRPGDALVRVHAAGISPDEVDVVLDAVGGTVIQRSCPVLRPGGLLVTIVRQPPDWTAGGAATGLIFLVEPHRRQLNELSRLIDAGAVRPVIEAILPLHQARQAYGRGIGGHPRGKLVLAVASDDGSTSGTNGA